MNASSTPLATVLPLVAGREALASRPDDELALLSRGGRREAFDLLVLRHQASALKLAGRYLGDASMACDAVQNAFLELHRALPTYVPRGRFAFFLRRLVLNQCRMVGRSLRANDRGVERLASEPFELVALPDESLLAKERQREVDRALQSLSTKLKEVVVLRYTGGHSLDEVAEILELPVGTVKSRLFAAMDMLRGEMEGAP